CLVLYCLTPAPVRIQVMVVFEICVRILLPAKVVGGQIVGRVVDSDIGIKVGTKFQTVENPYPCIQSTQNAVTPQFVSGNFRDPNRVGRSKLFSVVSRIAAAVGAVEVPNGDLRTELNSVNDQVVAVQVIRRQRFVRLGVVDIATDKEPIAGFDIQVHPNRCSLEAGTQGYTVLKHSFTGKIERGFVAPFAYAHLVLLHGGRLDQFVLPVCALTQIGRVKEIFPYFSSGNGFVFVLHLRVLAQVHYRDIVGRGLQAVGIVVRNLYVTGLAPFGRDQHDAVRSPGSVDCRSGRTLENFHAGNIGRVKGCQRVGSGCRDRSLNLNAIDHVQGLVTSVDGVDTADVH